MDLSKALDSGYSADEVLEFLISSFPYLGRKLRLATQIGHDAKSILNSLQGLSKKRLKELDEKSKRSRFIESNPIVQGQQSTYGSSGIGQIEDTVSNLKDLALAGGGAYLTGRALQNVMPQVSSVLSKRGVPRTPGASSTKIAPASMAQNQEALSPIDAYTANLNTPPPIESKTVAASPSQPEKRAAKDILDELGLTSKIDNLLEAGNLPSHISSLAPGLLTPNQTKWLKSQTDQPIEEIVNEYIQNFPQPKPITAEKNDQEIQTLSQQAVLPDGKIGRVVGEKQGISEIELPDGKIRRQKTNDLIYESPGLDQIIDDLMSEVPEEERSAPLAFVQYDEPNQALMIRFNTGDSYIYPGATKDQFEKIISNSTAAKTSGENAFGIFTKGEASRGAGAYQVIKELESTFGKNFYKFAQKGAYIHPIDKLLTEIKKSYEKRFKEKRKRS